MEVDEYDPPVMPDVVNLLASCGIVVNAAHDIGASQVPHEARETEPLDS